MVNTGIYKNRKRRGQNVYYKDIGSYRHFPSRNGGKPIQYDNELTRRTELGDSSGRYMSKHYYGTDSENAYKKQDRAKIETVEYVLGDGWIEKDRRGLVLNQQRMKKYDRVI